MVMLTRKKVLLAKSETTYGSDPTPTAASNAILAIDPDIKELMNPIDRGINISTLSNKASIAGVKYAEVTFKVELRGSGSAGTAPRLGALLKACGMDEPVVSSPSVTYEPVSSSFSSVTLYLYIDGRRHKVTGARGTFKMTCPAGQIAMLEFTFQGKWVAAANAAIVSGTYDGDPATCKSCSFSYNSKTTLVASQVELDMANKLTQRPSLNDATGMAGVEITGRKPALVCDIEDTVETSYDFRGDQLTNERAVSWVVGATAGNICTISVPKYNITNIEYADNDGVQMSKINGECDMNSGDDEVSIAFT